MVLGSKKKEIALLKQQIADYELKIDHLQKRIQHSLSDNDQGVSVPVLFKVLNINSIGVITYSIDNNMLWLSAGAKEIFGYKNDADLTLETLKNSFLPEDKVAFEKLWNDLLQGFKIQEIELKIARSEGEGREFRLLALNFTTMNNSGKNTPAAIIGSVKDITRQDKAKRDLIKAKEKAEESERLKNSLLANISHDIRTPMNSIIGFSELLNIGNLPFNKRLEYVRTIKNQGILLLKMIDDVVELTRIETGKVTIRKSPCNIDLLLNELVFVFNQYKLTQNKEHLEIKLNHPQQRGITIYTDPGRLQQLIWCLISNSIKYTEKGSIEIGFKPLAEQRIEFYVKDTGIGLSRDLQKKIFGKSSEEEALSNSGKSEGSGLGLTIAKNLIRLMGGKIWVESELGLGSTFYFTLPYEEIPETYHIMNPEEEFTMPSYTWKDKVILVVEDDEVNYKFLEAVLQDTSAQVLYACNGQQAIELCKSISKIDLVLMDIKMPEMDGYEATRQIREFNRKIPIIAQTAFVLEQELKKCRDAGCNDYLTKPIDIKEFFEKIDGFLKES
jgi:signal transduction histidine kinase/CheY-like chemotaxis protein